MSLFSRRTELRRSCTFIVYSLLRTLFAANQCTRKSRSWLCIEYGTQCKLFIMLIMRFIILCSLVPSKRYFHRTRYTGLHMAILRCWDHRKTTLNLFITGNRYFKPRDVCLWRFVRILWRVEWYSMKIRNCDTSLITSSAVIYFYLNLNSCTPHLLPICQVEVYVYQNPWCPIPAQHKYWSSGSSLKFTRP